MLRTLPLLLLFGLLLRTDNCANKSPAVQGQSITAPVLTPAPGTYTGSATVSISDATPNVQIYYTTDGSMPTTSSSRYTGPITFTASTTIKAVAVKLANGRTSNVSGGLYFLKLLFMVYLPPGQVGVPYTGQVTVTGGTPPIKLTVLSGTFPPGLTLAEDGRLLGKPLVAGVWTVYGQEMVIRP